MKRLHKPQASQPAFSWDEDSPIRRARLRMVELPTDESRDLKSQFLFPLDDKWVPVAVVNGNIHILPGVPRLCACFLAFSFCMLAWFLLILAGTNCGAVEGLLDGLKPFVLDRLAGGGIHRVLISTPLGESAYAEYLTDLASRVASGGVKVGSYPRMDQKRNTVTLVGR